MNGTRKLKFPVFLPALPCARDDAIPASSTTGRHPALTALDRPKPPVCPPCTSTQTNLAAILEPEPGSPQRVPLPSTPFPTLLLTLLSSACSHIPTLCAMHNSALEHRGWDGSVVLLSLAFPWKTTKDTDPDGDSPTHRTSQLLCVSARQRVSSCYWGQAPDPCLAKTFSPRVGLSSRVFLNSI